MPIAAWIGLAALSVTVMLQGLAFAFWAGRLSQRVTGLEAVTEKEGGTNDLVIRLDERMKVVTERLETMDRHLQGVNRQLANIASHGVFKPPTE